jgi:hypothetical protein
MVFTVNEFQKLMGIELKRGHFFTPVEVANRDHVAVFETGLFADIPEQEPLNQVWKAGDVELKTVGVVQPVTGLAAIHLRELGIGKELAFAPQSISISEETDPNQPDLLFLVHQFTHVEKKVASYVGLIARDHGFDVNVDAVSMEMERVREEVNKEAENAPESDIFQRRVALVDLRECKIDESVWDDLRALDNCRRLVVGNIELKTRSAMAIASIRGLRFLYLDDGTKIDDGLLQSIRQNNPDCRILKSEIDQPLK